MQKLWLPLVVEWLLQGRGESANNEWAMVVVGGASHFQNWSSVKLYMTHGKPELLHHVAGADHIEIISFVSIIMGSKHTINHGTLQCFIIFVH